MMPQWPVPSLTTREILLGKTTSTPGDGTLYFTKGSPLAVPYVRSTKVRIDYSTLETDILSPSDVCFYLWGPRHPDVSCSPSLVVRQDGWDGMDGMGRPPPPSQLSMVYDDSWPATAV